MQNKGLIITLIVLLSILVLGLITFLIIVLTNSNKFKLFSFNFDNTSKNLILEETYDNSFDEISIASKAADIEIKESSDNKVTIKIYSEVEESKVEVTDSKLKINSENKKCKFLCFRQKVNKIEIYVPSDYSNEIIVNSDAGDMEIESFKLATLDINLKAGDIKLDSAKKASIKNDCGDIKITGTIDELDVENSAGDINLNEVNSLKAVNRFGDIKVTKVNSSLNIEGKCGDIKISSINLEKDSKIENSMGDIEIGKTNDIKIEASTSLGDKKINNNYSDSNVTLKINNSCGDIEIDN